MIGEYLVSPDPRQSDVQQFTRRVTLSAVLAWLWDPRAAIFIIEQVHLYWTPSTLNGSLSGL
jgi:hypothetical protein